MSSATGHGGPAPVLRLALAESRRMVSHPAFLLSVLAVVVPWAIGMVTRGGPAPFPTLTNASWQVQMPMLIVATGAFFSGHLIGLRRYRFGTGEVERTQPLPAWQQSLAQVVATTAMAVVAAVLVAVHLAVLSTSLGAAASVLVTEAATVPVFVLLAGVLGVAAAHVGRTLVAGVSVFVVLGVFTFAGAIGTAHSWRWLSLAAFENSFEVPSVPALVAQRPSAWHLVWLLSLCVLVALVSMLATGLARPPALVGSASAALVALVAAIAQLTAAPLMATQVWEDTFQRPDPRQTCRTVEQVTYCAFDGFTSRVDAWTSTTRAQLDAVPAAVSAGPFYVRQRLPALGRDGFGYAMPTQSWNRQDAASGTPGAVLVSTRWAGGSDDSFAQTQVLAFALGFAHRLVAGEPAAPADGRGGGVELCGGPGIVTLWLAAGVDPAGRAALEVVQQHGDLVQASVAESAVELIAGFREAAVLEELLKADRREVSATIAENWSTLTRPGMTTDEAASVLGVQAPPPVSEEIGLCAGAQSKG